MPIDASPLFEPLEVKVRHLRNRIVMPPMVSVRSLTGRDGAEWYGERARGGVGLVIVEAVGVTRFDDDLTAANLRPLVQAIHDGGAVAAVQLFPSLRRRVAGPDGLAAREVARLLGDYERAAAIAIGAGFDGVEPHGAHGYLLNLFFSPEHNHRRDGYGGSLAARSRLALEIVDATRRGAGEGAIILYRHTPVGDGYDMDDSLSLAEALVAGGVDILDISPSSIDAPGDRAEPFMRFGVPVIAVNELDEVGRALEALMQGRASLIAVGRGLIADPEWANKVRQGRLDEIVGCTRCDRLCFGNLRRGEPIACTEWN